MRVCVTPPSGTFGGNPGGVHNVVEVLERHLPKHGFEVVTEAQADVIHAHAVVRWDESRPSVYTNHGVYPEPLGTEWQRQANVTMMHSLFASDVVTSVSRWATDAYKHLGRDVRVIPNGVDCDALKSGSPQGYVLWGKINLDGPCLDGCRAALKLAAETPKTQFVFTLVPSETAIPPNVKVIGKQSHPDMLGWMAGADAYLSTTKENFSVQVLEAMALGVPVLGLPGGGIDETEGPLVVDDLAGGLQTILSRRKQFSGQCLAAVREKYDWGKIVPRYIECYEDALKSRIVTSPVASIVITCYNLEDYVAEATESAVGQKFANFEVIVIDDGSNDESWEIIQSFGNKIKAYKQKNKGVAAARNVGVEKAQGQFVLCLDGDDRLHEGYLAKSVAALQRSPNAGFAYSPFALFLTGQEPTGAGQAIQWDLERLKRGNYIGNATLFRKEAWRRAGGYRDINPSWEDYNLWLTMAEAGYSGVAVPEWLWDYRVKPGQGRNHESQNQAARLRATVDAYHPRWYSPRVSVIVPCWKQERWLPEAVQSVLAQTFQDFEAIVVDDGSPGDVVKALRQFAGDPRVRLIRQENKGLAAARNAGIAQARGRYILPLDADDLITPEFLALTVAELDKGVGIAYTDFVAFDDKGHSEHVQPDYDFEKMATEKGMLFCTSLFPRSMWEEIGGYDETFKKGWEDYAFWLSAGLKGWHARKVPGFLFWYRQHKRSMRTDAEEHKGEIMAQLAGKFGDLYSRIGKGKDMSFKGFEDVMDRAPAAQASGVGMVRLEYVGLSLGGKTMIGPVTKTQYMFSLSPVMKFQFVDARDAQQLLALTGELRLVPETAVTLSVAPPAWRPPAPTVAEAIRKANEEVMRPPEEPPVKTVVAQVSVPVVEQPAAPKRGRGRPRSQKEA